MGTSNTRIYVKDKGVVVVEPTMVARIKRKQWVGLGAPQKKQGAVVAWGTKAKEMLNREPQQVEVVSPLKNGIIFDLEMAQRLIANYIKMVYEIPTKYPKIIKPLMVVGLPTNISKVQKRAIRTIMLEAGAVEVILVDQGVAAAIGLGVSMEKRAGMVIVDVGGGKTEVSVVSMGGVVIGRMINCGGIEADNSIINYIRMKYGLLIGQNTAERLKIEMGDKMLVRGRDLEKGLPKSIKVSKNEIIEAEASVVNKISRLVKEVLDETPPELMEDVLKRGVALVGGACRMKNLAEIISRETNIGVNVVDDAELAVVMGLGELLNNPKLLEKVKMISGYVHRAR